MIDFLKARFPLIDFLLDFFFLSVDLTAQGRSRAWWTPQNTLSATSIDEEIESSSFVGFLVDTIAVFACVVGPYMAVTGLRQDIHYTRRNMLPKCTKPCALKIDPT